MKNSWKGMLLFGVLMLVVSCCYKPHTLVDYSFVYAFNLQYEEETTTYQMNAPKVSDTTLVKGFIQDHLNFSIPGVLIRISNDKGEEVAEAESDFDGNFGISLLPGTYVMETSFVGFDTSEASFDLSKNTSLGFRITMGRDGSLTVCEVHSKRTLTEMELTEIRRCIERTNDQHNEFYPNKYCGTAEYFIVVQI